MLYLAYQTQHDLMEPVRAKARTALAGYRFWTGAQSLGSALGVFGGHHGLRDRAAAWEMLARARLSHERPAFAIHRVVVEAREVAVTEERVATTPFATLLRFRKARAPSQPRVLVVAPLSGHFATLLRPTVRTLLPDHDVYITDWHNARDVPPGAGRFGLDEYVDHVAAFLTAIGPGAHVLAVCQPCVQVLSAVAAMAEDGHPCQPRSMTLMAGPVDARINPTAVNVHALSRPLDWFDRKLIATVPSGNRGAGRRVYPGFLQLSSFMAMNMERHLGAHRDLHRHLVGGEWERAEAIKSFYDEYFSVLDLTAEFFLETVRDVFQAALLPKGELAYRGRRLDLGRIRDTALLTVEGERDDICGIGQTAAAHGLCAGLPSGRKRHHLQRGVGHYGVFSGKRWEKEIYPVFREMLRDSA
jgi:poly(3-hydroxybutyrate) depolymerase